MRPITKSFIGALVGVSMLVPAVAGAAGLTTTQVTAIVSLLQSFGADASTVTNVQLVLSGQQPSQKEDHDWAMSASSTSPSMGLPPGQMGKMACITLSRNLGPGSKGDDVKKLQKFLSEDKDTEFTANTTGVFGPATARAMMKFQIKNGIASSSRGSVGPMTRGFFERNCGRGLSDDHDNRGNHDNEGNHGGQQAQGTHLGGSITAVSGSSITVLDHDGKSVVVTVSASTTILVFAAPTGSSTATAMPPVPSVGTIADLLVGKMVRVEGMVNTDGSVNALHINVGMLPPPQGHEGTGGPGANH